MYMSADYLPFWCYLLQNNDVQVHVHVILAKMEAPGDIRKRREREKDSPPTLVDFQLE